jgi:hypothetical protein
MSIQQKSATNKLSERNVVEVLQKLVLKYDLNVIYCLSGKDYITPKRLLQEIDKEVHLEGRVSLLELPASLGVSIENIESRISEVVSKDVMLVNGQLLSRFYVESLCIEINLALQESGQLNLADLTVKYALPMHFFKQELEKRLGTIIFGHFSGANHLVTETYVTRHLCKLRGYLRACRKPVDLKGFDSSLLQTQVNHLLDTHQVLGKIDGLIFTPLAYQSTIWEEVKSQYFINKYLEFDYLKKKTSFLGLSDFKEICKKLENGEFFHSAFVDIDLVTETKEKITELTQNKSFFDFFDHEFPQCFDEEDLESLCPSQVFSYSHFLFTSKAVDQAVSSLNHLISSISEEVKDPKSKKSKENKETLSLQTIQSELKKKKFLNAPQEFLEGFSEAVYSKVSQAIQERRESRGRPAEQSTENLSQDFNYLFLCSKSIQNLQKKYPNTKPLLIHTTKTLASSFLNDLLKVQLNNQGFPTQTVKTNDRVKLIQKLPEYLRDIFNKLLEKITAKDLDGFIQEILANIKDIPVVSVKAVDKKTERIVFRKIRSENNEKVNQAVLRKSWNEVAVLAFRVKMIDNSLLVDLPAEKWAVGIALEVYSTICADDPLVLFLKVAAGNLEDENLVSLGDQLREFLSN